MLCGLFDPVRPCSASTREIPATATASPGAAASVSSRDPGGGPRISALTGAPSCGLAGLNEIAELHRVLARAPFQDFKLHPAMRPRCSENGSCSSKRLDALPRSRIHRIHLPTQFTEFLPEPLRLPALPRRCHHATRRSALRIPALTGTPSAGLAGLNELAEQQRVFARSPFRIATDARLEPSGLARSWRSAESGLRHVTILEFSFNFFCFFDFLASAVLETKELRAGTGDTDENNQMHARRFCF